MPLVRSAVPLDARRVAAVHTESWRVGYRGILPDHVVDEISIASRLSWWEHVLDGGVDGFHIFVVEDARGRVQGFGSACQSDNDPARVGEIAQLYLIPTAWGSGLAKPLLAELENDLRGRQFEVAELHVALENLRARRFYERRGWRDTGTEHREVVWEVEFVTTTYRKELRPWTTPNRAPRPS